MPALSNRSPMICSTTAASWTSGCARLGSSNMAPGTGTNFSKLRGENEKLSNGGKSSGLLSFLKIGDRAAKRDQIWRNHAARRQNGDPRGRSPRRRRLYRVEGKGGTESRRARHRLQDHQKGVKAIMNACVNRDGPVDACFDPAKNPALKKQIRLARRVYVPDAVITG